MNISLSTIGMLHTIGGIILFIIALFVTGPNSINLVIVGWLITIAGRTYVLEDKLCNPYLK